MPRFLDVILAGGAVFGAQYFGRTQGPLDRGSAMDWYKRLEKPEITPPAPAYAVVWTILDGLMAAAGYRLLRAKRSWGRSAALVLWALCVAGVTLYPVVVFRDRRLDKGLALCAGLVVASGASIALSRQSDPAAARLQLPFLAWLVLALVVQAEIWRRN